MPGPHRDTPSRLGRLLIRRFVVRYETMQKMLSPEWFDPGEVDVHSAGKGYTAGPSLVNLAMRENQGHLIDHFRGITRFFRSLVRR